MYVRRGSTVVLKQPIQRIVNIVTPVRVRVSKSKVHCEPAAAAARARQAGKKDWP